MVEKKTGVFNIASGKKINLLKIFELITKKKIKKTVSPKNNIFANINKIKNLGWKPKYDIIDIIETVN